MKDYQIKFLELAREDILNAIEYLDAYSSTAGLVFYQKLQAMISSLKEMPKKYPIYEPYPRYRKMLVQNHLVFYTIDEELALIQIYRVINGKMDIPSHLR